MRILHSADLHANKPRWPEVEASINTMRDDGLKNGCDLYVIAGDLADGPMQDSERDCFDALCRKLQALADIAPVAIIYGTPSHDAPGSLEVLERLQAENQIIILRPGVGYLLTAQYGIVSIPVDDPDARCDEDDRLLLFGVPEPNKKWLLAEAGATGKESSDAAVRDAMRALLLGLGGIRRQHSDLPCLLMYHGQVSGARSGTGFGVESGTGLAVSRDDLAAVGADYYALGDIHEPQQIGDLPAYYPGSIYPKDFGETHKAGCNVVEIFYGTPDTGGNSLFDGIKAEIKVNVSRLEFPHPQRVKISKTWDKYEGIFRPDINGKLAWVEITATREDCVNINPDAILDAIIKAGALEGSRVTLNILPTETVRAGEITEKKHLREKVVVYAENSALTPTETALEKADELEREAAAAGRTDSGAKIRITRLRLRGAIGTYKKGRKDEIDLDLEAIGPGVIAFVGKNGLGKTTIIENLHPWPRLWTRGDERTSITDHFRLRDSFRDLYFTDERTGIRYRALINIKAGIASASAEYFLYADCGDGYKPYAGSNGRKEPYLAAITELFGTPAMFLKTAFQTQSESSASPDISKATKGEKKTMFSELAGIDYLDTYRAEAKTRADSLDSDLLRLEATIDADSDVDEVIRKASEAIEYQRQAETAAAGDEERAQASLQRLTKEREALAAAVASLDRSIARKGDIEREISSLLAEVAEAEKAITGFQVAADGRGKAEEELARIAELEREAASLREGKAKVDEGNHRALAAYQDEMRALELRRQAAQSDVDQARKELAAADKALAVAESRLMAPVSDTCPTCGQTLPADRLEAIKHAREEADAEVGRLAAARAEAAGKVEAAESTLYAIVQPAPPEPSPFPGAARLAEIEADLAFTDADSLRAIIRKADEAAVRIEEAGRRKADAEARASRLTQEREELALEISGGLPLRDSLASKDREISAEREHITAAHGAAAAARAFRESAERNLADAQARARARDEAATKRDAITLERDDWRFLERACGADGIQALELDALAPSIATVANRLLEEAYGSRYAIRFDTTRQGGKGARAKQIEDFLVMITDSETGEEQEISTLSGGEAVWIKRALYDAFAAIRARNTGVQFLTAFQDEADGALDPEARMQYLRMLEAAHRESGRYQTILITHSKDLQAMIQNIINVEDLDARDKDFARLDRAS